MSAKGKALVSKLRKQAGVRDPEALAAYLGRFKQARKAGKSVGEAKKAAGGSKDSKAKSTEKRKDVFRNRPKVAAAADPFGEDFGENEKESKEAKQQRKLEERLIRAQEKADRSKLYNAIQEQGGLKTNANLKEEYSGIPNTFKRKEGLAGDDMADHLATYFPELGIQSERDLIDYLAA